MNIIRVIFVGCEPVPANGYNIQWRVFGSGDPYTDAGNFTTSPAVFTDEVNPEGTSYEGIIRSDCTESGESGESGNFGTSIPWTAIAPDSESGTVGVTWNYDNSVGTGGRFKILVNGVLIVNVTSSQSGTLLVNVGDLVEIIVQSTVTGLAETDITGPYTNSTSSEHITTDEFTVAVGSYVINGFSLPTP